MAWVPRFGGSSSPVPSWAGRDEPWKQRRHLACRPGPRGPSTQVVVRHREESTPKGIALFSPQGSGDRAEPGRVVPVPGLSRRLVRRVNLENCTVA